MAFPEVVFQDGAVVEGHLFRQVGSGKDPNFQGIIPCLRFSLTFCNVNGCNRMMSWISIWIRVGVKLSD